MTSSTKKFAGNTGSWDRDRLDIDNADSYEELIAQLYQVRVCRDLKQQDIAENMGTSKSAISRLEAGNGNPTMRTLLDYAEAVGAYLSLIAVPAHNTTEWKERARQVTDDLQTSFFCEVKDVQPEEPGKRIATETVVQPSGWSASAGAGV